MGTNKDSASIRIGTRSSRLALWQAEWVASRLRDHYPDLNVELVHIKTQGDRDQNSPLSSIGGTGLFAKEIQLALLEGRVDVAVHSLKDLPTVETPGLVLAAVPSRANVADALIAPAYLTLENMPPGSRVGTGSLRRQAQVLHAHPRLHVQPIRGNVDSRLAQALEGKIDGVVLAAAGLERLGFEKHITQRLDPPGFLPAVGQGALGVECRAHDQRTLSLVQALDCALSRAAVLAERAMLAGLGGGCLMPLGAWARQISDPDTGSSLLALDAAVFSPQGGPRLGVSLTGSIDDPVALGQRAAQCLREQGAEQLLQQIASS